MYKSQSSGRSGDLIFYGDNQYLWALSVELISRHRSGDKNFQVGPSFRKIWAILL